MPARNWFRQLSRRLNNRRQNRRRFQPRRKLQVEQLEQRMLLAAVFWDGNTDNDGGDGVSWNDALNWNVAGESDRVPTSIDDVTIDDPALNITVNVSGSVPAINSLTSTESLVIGGSLDIAADSEIASLTLNGGTLSGSGDMMVNTLNWTNGTIAGSGTTTVASTLVINDGKHTLDGRTLETLGMATLTGPTSREIIAFDNGAELNNRGQFHIQHDADLGFDGGSFGTGTFNNFGQLTFAGTGSTQFGFRAMVPFNNSGTVEVQSGSVTFHDGGISQGSDVTNMAQFQVTAGTSLTFGGDNSLNEFSAISGEGLVEFVSPGTTTIAGTYDVTGSSTIAATVDFTGTVNNVGHTLNIGGNVDFSDAKDEMMDPLTTLNTPTLNMNSGELNTGVIDMMVTTLNWNSGELAGSGTTTVASSLVINDGRHILDGRTLESLGTATLTGPTSRVFLEFHNEAELNNRGPFHIQHDADLEIGGLGNASKGTFNNFDELTFAGTGSTAFGALGTVFFNNNGTVDVQSGSVSFFDGYDQTADTARTILNGGQISGAIDISGGSLVGAGTVSGLLSNGGNVVPDFSVGTLTITQGFQQTASGLLAVDLAETDHDRLQVAGTVTLAGALSVNLLDGSAFGDSFVIIDNDGTEDPVDGMFDSLIVTGGLSQFEIIYDGGDGNDVVLAATNQPPVANANGDYVIDEGASVTLDASGSTDDQAIVLYEWDLDFDGTFNVDISTTSAMTTTSFPDDIATRDIAVRVTDNLGATDIDVTTLTVNNVDPTLGAVTFELVENSATDTVVGTVTAADVGDDTLTYALVGGSGAGQFVIDPNTGEIRVSSGAMLDFESTPSLTLEVEVTDDDGGIGTATATINLLNQASITGAVFIDANQNGLYDANEPGIDGVLVELLDASGSSVLATVSTIDGGFYLFEDLAPATYRLHEIQPTGVDDGVEILGSLGGSIPANDTMQLTLNETDGSDYDFAELGQQVTSGDTATIGFWQNKHGQSLITQGGAAVAGWFTSNFANVFGDTFSDGNGGDDGAEVAAFFKTELFKQKGKKSVAGPAKVDAQFMAVAFSTYFTSSNLAGNAASSFGFNVTDAGIGTNIVNVGNAGAAFGVADNTDMTIIQLLLATSDLTDLPDSQSGFAYIYDQDGDGQIDSLEAELRSLANDLYSFINELGDI